MTPEERDLITGLFARLKQADTPNKDPEAEALIRKQFAEFPAAGYLLTQTVLVQEQALKGAENRIAALEKQLADAQHAAPAPSGGGSFLNRVRRPWDTAPATPAPTPAAAPAAPAYAAPSAFAPQGGGFLQSALTTAAGVAGGALLFNGIERLLGHSAGPFGYGGFGTAGFGGSPWGATPTENVTVNNYYGDDAAGRTAQLTSDDDTAADPSYTEASYDDDGGDFGGGDSGGGDWT